MAATHLVPFMLADFAAAADPAGPACAPLPASPLITGMQPRMMLEGGPTHTAMSPMRAAGFLPMKTPVLPSVMGPPTCGMGGVPGVIMGHTCMSPNVAAGIFPISTVGTPGPVMVPPCAVMSVNRAAGLPGMGHLGGRYGAHTSPSSFSASDLR